MAASPRDLCRGERGSPSPSGGRWLEGPDEVFSAIRPEFIMRQFEARTAVQEKSTWACFSVLPAWTLIMSGAQVAFSR